MRTKSILMGGVASAALLAGSLLMTGPAAAGGEGETAVLTVIKTVVGTAPADAEFVINVLCVEEGGPNDTTPITAVSRPAGESIVVYDEDVIFGADGGEEEFVFFDSAACVITEIDDGGATSSTGPVEVAIDAPTRFEAEIVNTFEPGSTTTAAPEAPAAEAATATPRFTG